jgi:hypothetical protein
LVKVLILLNIFNVPTRGDQAKVDAIKDQRDHRQALILVEHSALSNSNGVEISLSMKKSQLLRRLFKL